MSARYVQPLRILIQSCFLGFMIWLGIRFYQFVLYFYSGSSTPFVERPGGIEGFLPISGLMGVSAWFKGLGINSVHPAAVVIFVTVLGVSLLLRRSFCSWICPVATISECSWKAGFRLFKRNLRPPPWLDIVLRGLKYLLLLFFVYSIVIAMPVAALQNFIYSDYHKVSDVRLLEFFLHLSPVALGVILTLLLLSLPLKNPFCRYLCPYGALLGLVAMLSPLRVTRDTERCVSCGVCSQVCPTYIDVMHKQSVLSPECIGCWRCISHCRFNTALSMRAAGRLAVPGAIFALLVVLLFWGGTLAGKWSGHWNTSLTIEEYARLLGK
ncbi:MAG: 4Fe-4S binding protein [Desulfuromonadaceae bacterium GWB2_53_15]|nr:MAG: 4Fe-4S binding protein [Desulfuromonadales bacterium GWD2_54_10]OHB25057.1 MAG: 4Fe-4S binding protein [Desulfuromonadaceae bacterium GWB2_53_15]